MSRDIPTPILDAVERWWAELWQSWARWWAGLPPGRVVLEVALYAAIVLPIFAVLIYVCGRAIDEIEKRAKVGGDRWWVRWARKGSPALVLVPILLMLMMVVVLMLGWGIGAFTFR